MDIINVNSVGILLLGMYIGIDLIKNNTENMLKRIIFYSFIFYLIVIGQLTTGGINVTPKSTANEVSLTHFIHVIPFYFSYDLWTSLRNNGLDWFFMNTIKFYFYNLIMLVPLGVYLALLFRLKSLKKAVIIVFLTSLTIETYQLLLGLFGLVWGRAFSVDDLILNTLGGAVGYIVIIFLIEKFEYSVAKGSETSFGKQ
ncbi:VanZ family protein [Salipaludibacillus neizhouensis]|nr:VanZ family protein [Salipaludibacillus neizhouensis]